MYVRPMKSHRLIRNDHVTAIAVRSMNRTRIRRALAAAMRLAILMAVPVALAELRTPAGDWPQFRGPNRDGKSVVEQGLLPCWPDS